MTATTSSRACRRLVASILVALLLSALAAATVHAQPDRVTVRVDGRPLFKVGPQPPDDAAQRARRIERRVATLLESAGPPEPARIQAPPGDGTSRVVSVRGVPLVTVTQADAQDNVDSLDVLALRWANALDEALDRASRRRTSTGARLLADTRGAIGAALARGAESAIAIVPRAAAAIVVVLVAWLLAASVRRLARVLFERVVEDRTFENLVKQVAYYAIWTLGLIVAADALGFAPSTVVTGLGLTSLALGFALKDVLSNFVSGLLLLTLRPFEIGDQIGVGETDGSVERIDLRATRIRTHDGRRVLVPNADLLTSRVVNDTASPVRRGSVTVHLGYDADLRRATGAALRAVARAEGVLEAPAPSILVRELGPERIVIDVRFWADSRRRDFQSATSAVRIAVLDGLAAADVPMPDGVLRVGLVNDGSPHGTPERGLGPSHLRPESGPSDRGDGGTAAPDRLRHANRPAVRGTDAPRPPAAVIRDRRRRSARPPRPAPAPRRAPSLGRRGARASPARAQ